MASMAGTLTRPVSKKAKSPALTRPAGARVETGCETAPCLDPTGGMFNNARRGANMPRTILRLPAVLKRRGKSRSSHYADVKAGLFVRPVKLGLRARGTPEDEVDALVAATIADKSDDEIRALVVKLEAARKAGK